MALWNRNKSNALPAPDMMWSNNTLSSLNGLGQAGSHSQLMQSAIQQMMGQGYGLMNAHAQASEPIHKPSAKFPNTLGWRSWVWDMTAAELRSPVHNTAWNGPELRCEYWDENDVVRGVAGIHAHLVPDDWHTLPGPAAPGEGRAYILPHGGGLHACIAVHGIVERFGKYVLGSDGWRAEWVVIRQLAAPTDEIGLALEQAFPDAEVVYGNR